MTFSTFSSLDLSECSNFSDTMLRPTPSPTLTDIITTVTYLANYFQCFLGSNQIKQWQGGFSK
jgi:hypothetical protein